MIVLLVIISLALLILVHEAGHFFAAKMFNIKVEEFGIGFPPKLFSKKSGETEYSFNLLPFGGFVKIFGENNEDLDSEISKEERERAFTFQAPWKKSVVMLAGVFMNIILAWILLAGVLMIGSPQKLVITEVSENSPAMEVGLESGDIISEVSSGDNVLEGTINTDNFVNFIDEHSLNGINMSVVRGEETLSFSVTGRDNPPSGEGSLGITFLDVGFEKEGFFSAIAQSFEMTWNGLKLIVVSFITLIVGLFSSSGTLENLTGPVGIFVLAKEAGTLGIVYLLQLTAIISLNLAVLNLIPFPALDGGRFLVILAEKIKGSPVSKKIQMNINAFGFILLIALMIIITVKDVGRFIL